MNDNIYLYNVRDLETGKEQTVVALVPNLTINGGEVIGVTQLDREAAEAVEAALRHWLETGLLQP